MGLLTHGLSTSFVVILLLCSIIIMCTPSDAVIDDGGLSAGVGGYYLSDDEITELETFDPGTWNENIVGNVKDSLANMREKRHPHDVSLGTSLEYPTQVLIHGNHETNGQRIRTVSAANAIASVIVLCCGGAVVAGLVWGCLVWFCCRGPDHEFVTRKYTLNRDIQDSELRHRHHDKRDHHYSDDDEQ